MALACSAHSFDALSSPWTLWTFPDICNTQWLPCEPLACDTSVMSRLKTFFHTHFHQEVFYTWHPSALSACTFRGVSLNLQLRTFCDRTGMKGQQGAWLHLHLGNPHLLHRLFPPRSPHILLQNFPPGWLHRCQYWMCMSSLCQFPPLHSWQECLLLFFWSNRID